MPGLRGDPAIHGSGPPLPVAPGILELDGPGVWEAHSWLGVRGEGPTTATDSVTRRASASRRGSLAEWELEAAYGGAQVRSERCEWCGGTITAEGSPAAISRAVGAHNASPEHRGVIHRGEAVIHSDD